MRTILILLSVLIVGCAWSPNTLSYIENDADFNGEYLTLCVTNLSITSYRIFLDGRTYGRVHPGETRRIQFPTLDGGTWFMADALAGTDLVPGNILLGDIQYWEWRLYNSPIASKQSVQPARELCD